MPNNQAAAAPDLSSWPTREEAADTLRVSLATLDRWIAVGKFDTATRPRPGKKPAIVLNPADVERMRPQPASTPAFVDPHASDGALALRPQAGDPMALFAAIAAAMGQTRPVEPQKFLTLEEAAEATGLTVTYLNRRIKDGTLSAIKDGRVKVRKGDLSRL